MRTFFVQLAMYLLPFVLITGGAIGLAWHAGEAMPLNTVHDIQEEYPDTVFLPRDRETIFAYKFIGVQRRHPDVVVVGSSRVLNFRSNVLTVNPSEFYNAGQSGMRLDDILALLNALTPETAPRTLLIGLDQFWFNPAWEESRDKVTTTTTDIGLERILLTTRRTVQDVLSGVITLDALAQARDPIYGGRAIGMTAIEKGNGYLFDGSRQTDVVTLSDDMLDQLRRDDLRNLDREGGNLVDGVGVNTEIVTLLDRTLARAADLDIEVIGILLPYMPTMMDEVQARGSHTYISDIVAPIERVFEAHQFRLFDFTDPRTVLGEAVVDTEMSDAIHPSERLSTRIFASIADAVPPLGALTNTTLLRQMADAAETPHTVFRPYPPR